MAAVNPWQQQALAHWETINRLAERRFPQGGLAEEAALFVMDRLADDDWQRLRLFGGRSTLATYIAALTLRLLEDFARARFGRVKPPLWIRRLGGLWLTLFRLLCLERFSPFEAVAVIGNRQPDQMRTAEEAAYKILGELPHCGAHRGAEVEFDEATVLPDGEADCSRQEHQLEQEERHTLFTVLGRVLFDDLADEIDPHLLERLGEVQFDLQPKERLLLKLCYRDGVAVAEAGRMLGWNRFQAHGCLRRLLARLRHNLARAGLDQELRLLL
jgi:DNA-directed RNA polymerase specialized sigma24 family protein